MSNEWQAAIEHLYATFACYRRPTVLDASPARDPVALMRDLSSGALRELPPEALGAYAGHALTTVGSEGDYRHFLPRIIELSITQPGWMGLEPEQIAQTLNYGHWRSWAQDAQEAIASAMAAAWREARTASPDLVDASSQLCALAILKIDIAPLLAAWTSPTSAEEVRQMAGHIQVASRLAKPIYWEWAPVASRAALWAWARNTAVHDRLQEAALLLVCDDDLWEIDTALIDISVAAEP